MTIWESIKEGYGLEELPFEIANQVGCWGGEVDGCKLYTDQNIRYSTQEELTAIIANLNLTGRVWCKQHALEYFR